MSYFDALIRAGLDTDAIRFLSQEYYDNGKMGHTRKLLLERVAEKLDKAEAEVERLTELFDTHTSTCVVCDHVREIAALQTENAKLRKVVETAQEVLKQIERRTKTLGLDMSNYHAISIQVKPGDAGKDYWQAVWAYKQALAELDKEERHEAGGE